MAKLRYISLENISAQEHSALWEYSISVKPTQPTLIIANQNEKLLTLSGNTPISELIDVSKLPADLKINRKLTYSSKNIGALLFEPSGLNFYLFIPNGQNENEKVKEAIVDVCKSFNINAEAPIDKNDIYITVAGHQRKFSGQLVNNYLGYNSSITNLSFDFDYGLAGQIFKIDISNKVIGLKEKKANIVPDTVRLLVAQKIAEKLGLELESSSLTTEERTKIDETISVLNNPDWIYNAKRPLETYVWDDNRIGDLIPSIFKVKNGKLIQKNTSIIEKLTGFETIDGTYTGKFEKNLTNENPLKYQTDDGEISFLPTGLRWDTGEIIKNGINNVSAEKIKDGFEIQGRRNRNAQGVIYRNAYGEHSNIGVLTHTTLWRKILSLYSLEELGQIPDNAQYLEIPFEINTTYNIHNLSSSELKIDGKIKLGEKSWIKKSKAWDIRKETIYKDNGSPEVIENKIIIDSFLKQENGKLYFIKRIPIEWLKSAMFPIFTDVDITYGSESEFEANATLYTRVAAIDTNKFVVVYNDAGAGQARVATVSETTITWGTESEFCADTVATIGRLDVCKLDTDKFVVVYQDDAADDDGFARVGTVSTTTISWGTAVEFSNNNNAEWTCCCPLGTDKFVAVWNVDVDDNGKARVCTVSGSIITADNTIATFNAAQTNRISVAEMASDKFVVLFDDNIGAALLMCGTVDEYNDITFGAECSIFSTFHGIRGEIIKMDTDKFVAVHELNNDKISDTLYLTACTISTRTITAGTRVSFANDGEFANAASLVKAASSTTEFFVLYTDTANSNQGTSQKGTVTWADRSIVASGTEEVFETGGADYISAVLIDGANKFVVVYNDTDDTNKGKAVIGDIGGATSPVAEPPPQHVPQIIIFQGK